MENLKVGRIVHYVAYGTPGGEFPKICRMAAVTEVHPSTVEEEKDFPGLRASLCVLNPSGLFFNQRLPESPVKLETPAGALVGGTWHDPRSCSR